MTDSYAVRPGLFLRRPLLRKPVAGVAADSLEHVFVIAGPSGSGKSTIMREFVCGRLPRDISDHLPREAASWHRTSGNELTRKGLAALHAKCRTRGLVVHYDIMRAYTRGFEHYATDPAMRVVTDLDTALTVLTILPSREALFEQFLARARNQEYEEWWDRKRLRRTLRRKLRQGFYRLAGVRPKLLKEGHLQLLRVYGSDERLARWTGRWDAFLENIRRERSNARLIHVAPEASCSDYPSFRLLRLA